MTQGLLVLVLLFVYLTVQGLYLVVFAVHAYFFTRPVDWITAQEVAHPTRRPPIVLFYPVLRESEETMRTTLGTIAAAQETYAPGKALVVAVPNSDDILTIGALIRLCEEFVFLKVSSQCHLRRIRDGFRCGTHGS